ncbi:cytosolic carboxypeptidase 2 isoform B [Patagioenas fasciata monilis]|uniref:Cytosolic carboxypeptidase 2 n=1 Tax=Patagioenas fasciata monilis TaxID=372326 RepID=A0A1V4JPP9_PATFA|nr:cytosolic carboxypeptidase 2 isoform B [Patagioenas fasciata monilis]
MRPSGPPRDWGPGGFGGKLLPEPYDSFMRSHLRYYGYFQGQRRGGQKSPVSQGVLPRHPALAAPTTAAGGHPGQELSSPRELEPVLGQDRWVPSARGQGTSVPSVQHRRCPGDPQDLFALPSARGPLPAPRWPIECEVIKEPIEHIDWVPPEPEPFCQPTGPAPPPAPLGEDQGTVVYQLSPASPGSCFTRARVGGSPGPLSSPATPLEGPQDTTLLFESRFESGNLQKAVKVGPFEYVLWLRPDLYTAKHTQWFYFRVQNTRRDHLYRFTIANLAKPKSLYNEGMRPLLYSQRDAESCGIGWRRVGTDIRYYRGGAEEPAAFCLSWTARFPHDGDTCFFAHSYPYTYSDLRRYLRALCRDPARSQLCTVRALCRSLAGNTVYLLTIGSPAGVAGKRAVVLSARAHPGESGGSWAMRGLLDFLLSADADARILRQLFDFMVVPMLNPDGVVVGNSRCSLAGRDPNRAYGAARGGSFPGVWHLRAMVERVLAEREVVLYCDFHGHSRKNNVFMYGCDGGGAGSGARLRQRVFPLMLSKNAPNKFSFPSCKFKVQKSKAGTGRVVMWRLGVSHSYTMEAAFGGSTLGGRNSHFTVQDLKSLGSHLCDTLLDFCDPDPAKLQRCLAEVDALLRRRLGREPGCGGWSDVSPSELESSTSGSDTSVSDGPPDHLCSPEEPPEQRSRKRLRSRRARNTLCQPNAVSQTRASVPARPGPRRTHTQPALPGTLRGGGRARREPSAGVTVLSRAGAERGRHTALPGSQLDGGTSAVPRRRPPLSTRCPGATGGSSQDTAPGAPGTSRRRGAQVAAVRGHRARLPINTPGRASAPAAPRCCACARH